MTIACPSCRQTMHSAHYARTLGGSLELDLCFSCQLIWFDQHESAQLAPAAVVELFEQLHAHHAEAQAQPLAQKLACVRCSTTLLHTHDQVRGNRFVYHRCPKGHGRLIGFWHFLREKQFVRDLSAPERQQLALTVAQVKCNSCGGPVNVSQDEACSYCRAPLAVLDRNAVATALASYRQQAEPVAESERLLAMERVRQLQKQADRASKGTAIDTVGTVIEGAELLDLIGTGLAAIFSATMD